MKVTPLDLRQQRFQTVMRGYDRGEVQAFLLEVADDYENALRENDKLRQDVTKLDAVLAEHRGQERNLRNTLLTAQKHADDIKEHAQAEAVAPVDVGAQPVAHAQSVFDDLEVRQQDRVLTLRDRELDGRTIGAGKAGPITKALQKAFFDVVTGKDKKRRSWLTPVSKKK